MAAEQRLRAYLDESLTAEVLELTRQAEAARDLETRAVTRIQSAWRSFYVRRSLKGCAAAALYIQRCWRGFSGRLRVQIRRDLEAAALRQAYFDAAATRIQCHWRGIHSRRVKHNFYKRKAFLQQVLNATTALRAELAVAHEEQLVRLQHEAEAADLRRFEQSLKGRHHLLSTSTKVGVFRARYWQQGEAGDAIELKLRGSEKHGWAATIGQPGGVPPAGPPKPRYRATIASTEPYSADKERASVDRAVERMLRAGGDFLKAVKSEEGPPTLSLAASEPFKMPITNVVPERSVPRKWTGAKPKFKTAFPDSKLFDFYDTTMELRPPEEHLGFTLAALHEADEVK